MDENLTSASHAINLHSDMALRLDQIIFGHCPGVLKKCDPQSVDLVVTSPPYADRRSKTYDGIRPDEVTL